MLNLKKTLQKYFKLTGYFLFKVLYGRIVGTVNAESESGIKVDLIKKNDKSSYRIYKIDKGRLYTDGVSDTAIIKNKKIIDGPSFQFRTINSEVINTSANKNLVFLNGTPRFQKKINGKVMSLLTGGAGNENYWHWMFDVLPRFGICEDLVNLDTIDFFLVPDNRKKFQIETLEILKIPKNKQISSAKFRHILAEELYLTSHPVALSDNSTESILKIPGWISKWLKKKFVNKNLKNTKNFSKKIYLDRSDSKSNVKSLRSVINEEELKNHLLNEGFKFVKLADLHFKDQVMTFNEADIIVGLHGAGFANMPFSKPNTKIIELKANPLDDVIKNLAIKNNLIHKSIDCALDEVKPHNQFGHVRVPMEELDRILKV
tara:strand:+ start:50 stop:1171 length:1122 start_codon:yes stop_codon:yes gene_type:complete